MTTPQQQLQFFQNMQAAMDTQATKIWDMVEYSRSSGYRLRLGEVTVTELNFYALRKFWTRSVYITTNEPNESLTGADWEWLIGHGNEWVQIRVQAKIINRSGSFDQLGHPDRTGRQMNTLINPPLNTTACRWIPLYVFYAASPPSSYTPKNTTYGCSARLAEDVRATYQPGSGRATLTAAKHLPDTVPWSRIFAGLVQRLNAGASLHSIVSSLANKSFPATPQPRTVDDFWDASVSGGACSGELPKYIQEIIARRHDSFSSANVSELVVRTPNDSLLGLETRAYPAGQGEKAGPLVDFADLPQDEFDEIPQRFVDLSREEVEQSAGSIPRFVAVIDIDRLPMELPSPSTFSS